MNLFLIQSVLGQENDGLGGIIQLLIFVLFIVVGIIRSLFAAKQEQSRKQNQKKPVKRPISQKAPDTAEKIRMQRERYEQFLENILQPKKAQQKQSSKPAQPRPQTSGPVSQKTPSVTKVYTSKPTGPEPYQRTSPVETHSQAEELLDTKMHDIPAMDTRIEQMPQFKEEHIQQDQRHLIHHDRPRARRATAAIDSAEPIYAFEGPDDLKKAIIYTEILGKPISLRETEALFD